MDTIKLVRDTYTDRHCKYIPEEGWNIVKQTKRWSVIATPMDDTGSIWDIWLRATSERQLSALLKMLEPFGLGWYKLDGEAYTKCDVLSVFDTLDALKLSQRKKLTGRGRYTALANLPNSPFKAPS